MLGDYQEKSVLLFYTCQQFSIMFAFGSR